MVVPATDKQPRLGPTANTRVAVNGVPTNALVDTVSPATILSLEFALEETTDKQWQTTTHAKFKDPDIVLKNYGGQLLHFIAQIDLSLSQGDQQVNTTVLVRKGAPKIGTDAHKKLGFSLTVREEGGDLFSGREVHSASLATHN